MPLDELRKALKLSREVKIEKIERIPTGILSIDLILGGGFPIKRVSELYGWSLSGKTYMMLRTARIFLDRSPLNYVIWFDREGALDEDHLEALSIDKERFVWVPPADCATADDLMDRTVPMFDALTPEENVMVVIDSIGAYVKGQKELSTSTEDQGRVAKGIKAYLRKVIPLLDMTKESLVLAANHLYLSPSTFGAQVKKSGGTGIDFLRHCGLALQATKDSDVTNPSVKAYYLWAVADKTRALLGDQPAKTAVVIDKGGKGIHPLSGLAYFLALWGKLTPSNKAAFEHPHAHNEPTFMFNIEEKKIRFNPESDYERTLSLLDKYGVEAGIPAEIISKAHEYVEKYDFHKVEEEPGLDQVTE